MPNLEAQPSNEGSQPIVEKVPPQFQHNVPGEIQVDARHCFWSTLCMQRAHRVFGKSTSPLSPRPDLKVARVRKQPINDVDIALTGDAIRNCPTGAIIKKVSGQK